MLKPGELLHNRYRINRQLGHGGMGAVYEATDTKLDCIVALKEAFTTTDDESRRAFTREAKLLANLDHRSLPRVTDHFEQDGALFLVMQYVEGEDLHAMMLRQQAPCRVADVLSWANQLLDVLDYLHTQQPPVVHRDIKPANIKLASRNRIVLLDFGLAKGTAGLMSGGSGKSFGIGTPLYAPLEQLQGRGTDARSDIFSLASTLWTLLTYSPPVNSLARAWDVSKGKANPLPLARALNHHVSIEISEVLKRAMSLDADERPASAIATRDALLWSNTPTLIEPSPPKPIWDTETLTVPQTFKNRYGIELVLIPSGSFRMGGDEYHDEKPVHQVTIGYSFYMGRTEVTQAQWQAVMGTTVREQRDKVDKSYALYGEGDNYPMY